MIILGTNSIKDTGFDVANSLRFNDGSSDSLTRTTETPTNADKFTFSAWVKMSAVGTDSTIISQYTDSNNRSEFGFISNGKLRWEFLLSGSVIASFETNRLFRDPSAWFHFVLAYDSTDGTAGDRFKIYINGVRETSFSSSTNPDQNQNSRWQTSGLTLNLGERGGGAQYFDGYMSEVVMIDGSALAPTSFGEFDDSGIWKPKNVSGLTFGNNGFYLEYKQSGTSTNASGMGADTSGNANNFTVNNLTALDQSTDTCTNNFNTWLATDPRASNFTLSEGNLKIYRSGTVNPGQSVYAQSMMPTSGKWYVEAKIVDQPAGDTGRLGIANFESIPGNMIVTPQSSSPSSVNAVEVSFGTSGYVFFTINGSDTENSSAPGFSSGDIIMLAVDIDNGKFYVGSQGAWWNYSSSATGGDPTSGSGYVSNSSDLFNGSPICFHQGHSTGTSKTSSLEWNFGSPSFSISSGNTDGNGYGNFEYAVPSGYFALNTKNLAEYG